MRGSIPAHAGEPRNRVLSRDQILVYPRACGGTLVVVDCRLCGRGLSPRMRGNLLVGVLVTAGGGSIPAHAGEPDLVNAAVNLELVYPRACGGTGQTRNGEHLDQGLSPRMRGNRTRRPCPGWRHGSIPAHAGEPDGNFGTSASLTVYPRACGGTISAYTGRGTYSGLSPRMRGNHKHLEPLVYRFGSIPAHAGEPGTGLLGCPVAEVYPRACGGTALSERATELA